MDDKLMHIPNDDTQNYPFCRLKLVVQTNNNLVKVPKVVKPTNKKTLDHLYCKEAYNANKKMVSYNTDDQW